MLKGKIIINEKSGNLCINGTLPQQNYIKIKQSDIEEFELKEGDSVEYDGIPYQTVDILNKVFDLQVQFIFNGEVSIMTDSQERAEEYFQKHVGLVIGGDIHSSLPDDEVNWDFNVHPEKIIIPKDQEG